MPPKPTSYKSFKPPRPVGASSAGSGSKGLTEDRSKGRAATVIDSSSDEAQGQDSDKIDDEENDDSDVFMQDVATKTRQGDPAAIPPKLITRLLHEHFAKDDTRITKDAMIILAKYIEVFALEAVGRAIEERSEAAKQDSSIDASFLEVEDLEKLAPQLLLDF